MSAMPLRYKRYKEVEYPESDGKPMAETGIHVEELLNLLSSLIDRYRDVLDVYVAGNNFLYYVEGNPRYAVSPDVYVVRGVDKHLRNVFKLWEENPPCFVCEVTSRSTRREDLEKKHRLYEEMGVEEYFLHDPLAEYLRPPLQGHRLVGGRYQRIQPEPDGSLVSRTLGVLLRQEERESWRALRLVDLETGERLLTMAESREKNRRLDEQLVRSEAVRQSLEDELARLRRELAARND